MTMDQNENISSINSITNDKTTLIQDLATARAELFNLMRLIEKELNHMNQIMKKDGTLEVAIDEGIDSVKKLSMVGGISLDENDIKNITDVNSTIAQSFTNQP